MTREIYHCIACETQFLAPPGPTQCPKCKHIYVEWLTYNEKTPARGRGQVFRKGNVNHAAKRIGPYD